MIAGLAARAGGLKWSQVLCAGSTRPEIYTPAIPGAPPAAHRTMLSQRFGLSEENELGRDAVEAAAQLYLRMLASAPQSLADEVEIPDGDELFDVPDWALEVLLNLTPILAAKLVPLLTIVNTATHKRVYLNALELYSVAKSVVPGANLHNAPLDLLSMMDPRKSIVRHGPATLARCKRNVVL